MEKNRFFWALRNYYEIFRHQIINFRLELAALSLYTILTIIFTYPIAFSSDLVPGGGDAFFYLWDIWWFKHALMSLTSPYWTPYLFYPSGLNLAFSTISPSNGFLSVPLQFVFGIVQTYNILWLLSFILAGFGTFLLVNYLTKSAMAGFIAGIIYMFSPYHFAHALGHLSLLSIQWIPFFVYFLFKTIKEPNIKNEFLAAFFLILVGITDYTYLMYSFMFTGILVLFYAITMYKQFIKKEILMPLFRLFVIFCIGFFPFAYPLLAELVSSHGNYMYSGLFSFYSADLIGFFIPSQLHPIFGKFVDPIYQNFTGNMAEYTVFIGYTVIFLSLVAVVKNKSPEIRLWITSAIVFFILALGPVLHINGVFKGTIEGLTWVIPLPFLPLMKIPVLSMARAPGRFDVMVMLSLAVLAGFGLAYIFKRYSGKTVREISLNSLLSVIFIVFILFEFLTVPYPMGPVPVPEFYYSLAHDGDSYGIYEIPDFGPQLGYPEYMYYQTVHNKPITTGYTKISDSAKEFAEKTPFINTLYTVHNYTRPDPNLQMDIINQNLTLVAKSIMNFHNIRYVILHENYLSDEQIRDIRLLLERGIDKNSTYYPKDHMRIYKVPPEPPHPFIELGSGFFELESWSKIPTRWTSDDASVHIYSVENLTTSMSFQAVSFYHPRTIQIYNGEGLISTQNIPADIIMIKTSLDLSKGENIIRLHSTEGCERPMDIPLLKNADPRCLSVAIQNVNINSLENFSS